jgi:hypothetical protein
MRRQADVAQKNYAKFLEPIIWFLLQPVHQNHRPGGNMTNSKFLTRILAPLGDVVVSSANHNTVYICSAIT